MRKPPDTPKASRASFGRWPRAQLAAALGVEESHVGALVHGDNTAYRGARGWRPPLLRQPR